MVGSLMGQSWLARGAPAPAPADLLLAGSVPCCVVALEYRHQGSSGPAACGLGLEAPGTPQHATRGTQQTLWAVQGVTEAALCLPGGDGQRAPRLGIGPN